MAEALIPVASAAVPVAREAVGFARRGTKQVYLMSRGFAREGNIDLGFKLLIVLGMWGLGLYGLYLFAKSGAKHIVETYALPAGITMVFPGLFPIVYGIAGWSDIQKTIGDWINPPKSDNKLPEDTVSDATKEITNYLKEMKTYIIIWSIFCLLIAAWVYYEHRKGQRLSA